MQVKWYCTKSDGSVQTKRGARGKDGKRGEDTTAVVFSAQFSPVDEKGNDLDLANERRTDLKEGQFKAGVTYDSI